MSDALFHTTSSGALRSILDQRRLKPRGGESLFVSLSERPLVHGDIRGRDVVLEFAKEPLSRRLLEVDYSEEWADAHPDHVSYIAGEGWREQFVYEASGDEEPDWEDEEAQWAGAERESFLEKSDELEWITRRPGQIVRFRPEELRRVLVNDHEIEDLRLEFPWVRFETFSKDLRSP